MTRDGDGDVSGIDATMRSMSMILPAHPVAGGAFPLRPANWKLQNLIGWMGVNMNNGERRSLIYMLAQPRAIQISGADDPRTRKLWSLETYNHTIREYMGTNRSRAQESRGYTSDITVLVLGGIR